MFTYGVEDRLHLQRGTCTNYNETVMCLLAADSILKPLHVFHIAVSKETLTFFKGKRPSTNRSWGSQLQERQSGPQLLSRPLKVIQYSSNTPHIHLTLVPWPYQQHLTPVP